MIIYKKIYKSGYLTILKLSGLIWLIFFIKKIRIVADGAIILFRRCSLNRNSPFGWNHIRNPIMANKLRNTIRVGIMSHMPMLWCRCITTIYDLFHNWHQLKIADICKLIWGFLLCYSCCIISFSHIFSFWCEHLSTQINSM